MDASSQAQPAVAPPTARATRLLTPLQRLRTRLRLYLLAVGCARLSLVIVGAATAQLLIDRTLDLPVEQRILLNIVITGVWLWSAYRTVWRRAASPLSDLRLAQLVDRHFPALQDRTTAAVCFLKQSPGETHDSPALRRALLDEVENHLQRVNFFELLNTRRLRTSASVLAAMFGVSVLGFQLTPDLVHTWFARNWLLADISWPQDTYIYPADLGADRVVYHPRGENLRITARFDGEPPTNAVLHWRSASDAAGTANMTRTGSQLSVSLGSINEDMRLYITGGDARTRPFDVRMVERPRVVRSAAAITPPAYTGLPPVEIEQETALEVLSGSRVALRAYLNKPVVEAELVSADGQRLSCAFPEPDIVAVDWSEPMSGSYYFAVRDEQGFENIRPVRFNLKVTPDMPPQVELDVAAVREYITPNAVLTLSATFRDTYGLTDAALFAQRQEDPPASIPAPAPTFPRRSADLSVEFPVRQMQVEPGQRLKLWAAARDNRPPEPNEAISPVLELRVLSQQDYLDELARRELELRRELEALLSEQRGLRSTLAHLDLAQLSSASGQQQLSSTARRQGWLAERSQRLSGDFRALLAEMQTNRVARLADEIRLRQRIAEPLSDVGRTLMPTIADDLAELRDNPDSRQLAGVVVAQDELIAILEAVLAQVQQWEGYREAVELLEEIIADQEEVRAGTVESLTEELEAILGPLDVQENATPAPGGG